MKSREEIETFLQNFKDSELDRFEALVSEAQKDHIPIIERHVAQFLRVLIHFKKPQRILEIGTGTGYSALILKTASEEVQELISYEVNSQRAERARANIERYQVPGISVKEEDIFQSDPGEFDFIFIDAGKSHYRDYFNFSKEHLKEDGVILCDNIFCQDLIFDSSWPRKRRTMARNMKDFVQWLLEDTTMLTTIIPIDDGLTMSVRR